MPSLDPKLCTELWSAVDRSSCSGNCRKGFKVQKERKQEGWVFSGYFLELSPRKGSCGLPPHSLDFFVFHLVGESFQIHGKGDHLL